MKVLLITIFIATVSTLPIPDDNSKPIEILNGVYQGESLKVGEILDVKLYQDTGRAHIVTEVHHPYNAIGVAETVATVKQSDNPDLVSVPEPTLVSAIPKNESGSMILLKPTTAKPIVPEAIATGFSDTFDSKTVIVMITSELAVSTTSPDSDNIALSIAPGIVTIPEEVPAPAARDSEFYNDEISSLSVNGSESPGMLSTLQSWFNMVLNYFNSEGDQSAEDLDSE